MVTVLHASLSPSALSCSGAGGKAGQRYSVENSHIFQEERDRGGCVMGMVRLKPLSTELTLSTIHSLLSGLLLF